jgi:hypothetical protein
VLAVCGKTPYVSVEELLVMASTPQVVMTIRFSTISRDLISFVEGVYLGTQVRKGFEGVIDASWQLTPHLGRR